MKKIIMLTAVLGLGTAAAIGCESDEDVKQEELSSGSEYTEGELMATDTDTGDHEDAKEEMQEGRQEAGEKLNEAKEEAAEELE
ncbi:MAG: hypothetical protein H6714_04460 [Myxococcales bacterium]|nr:hypothetical protein [Myxococcales bacterium]